MNKFIQLRKTVLSTEKDFDKFYYKNNAAAGRRIRKVFREANRLAEEIRVEITLRRKEKY